MFLLDSLQDKNNLTNNEQQIAGYILEHLDSIPSMTINELAKNTYTSHSAIVRLAQKMGYDGFKEFKLALSKVAYHQQYSQSNVNVNFPFDPYDSAGQIAKKMADLSIATIQNTHAQIDEKALSKAAEQLDKAKRIFLFSVGDSQIRSRSFQNKMVKINKFVILAEEYSDETWAAANLDKEDCALFLSYGANSKQHLNMITHFHKQKIPAIVITGNLESDLVKFASLVIAIKQSEDDFFKIATFSSQIAFEYILDTLFSILYTKEFQGNLANLKRKHELFRTVLISDNPKVE